MVDYLAAARVVHVTSFLDERTPGRLLKVLRAVKELASGTAICFDPGHVWSAEASAEIEELLGLSDYLLVNYREFRELGRHVDGESDETVAARLVARTAGGRGVVVVKLPTGIWSYQQENAKLVSDFYAQVPVAPADIKDATGAGDVFAAGLLTVLTSDKLQSNWVRYSGCGWPGTSCARWAVRATRSSPRSPTSSFGRWRASGGREDCPMASSSRTARTRSGSPSNASLRSSSNCRCTRSKAEPGVDGR